MNQTQQPLSKRDVQFQITQAAKRDTALTDDWLRDNGIDEKQLQAGLPEVLQAQRLATAVLSNYGKFLAQNQALLLNNFLVKANRKKTRMKITLGQCYKVMNITKEAQRKFAKKLQAQHQQHTQAH